MQLPPNVARGLRLLALGLLALWTLYGLDRPIGDGDEAIHAETLREMLRSGDYLHTRWHGLVLHERPPLMYWLALPFAALSGSEVSIRMSSALLSFGTLLLVYRSGCRFLSQPTAALTGAILLAAVPSYHDYTRTLMTEAPLVMATTLALSGALLALQERTGLLLAAAGLGAGIAVKSWAGVLPLLALAPWLIWAAKKRGDRRTILSACAVFMALALPYFAFSYFEDPAQFLREHVGFHLVQRVARGGSFGLRGGVGAYLRSIPGFDGPWISVWLVTSVAAGLIIGRSARSLEQQRLLLLSSYSGLFFLGISCIGTHNQHYVLPLYVAAALTSSGVLAHAMKHWPPLQKAIWRPLAPALASWLLIVSLPYPGGRVILLEGPYSKVLGTKARELDPKQRLYVYEWYAMAISYYADRPIVLLTMQPERFKALNIPDHMLSRAHVPALVPPLPAAAGESILIAGHVNDLSRAKWFKVDNILAAAPPYFLARAVVQSPAAHQQAQLSQPLR